MKKLKCESCGGDIEIDESKNLATCPFCNTKYQLNETKNVYLKVDEDIKKAALGAFERNQKISKVMFLIFGVFFVFIFGIVAYNIFKQTTGTSEFDIRSFNSKYEINKGTEVKENVNNLIDNIVTNNKTNKRKITVVFNGESITDPDKLVAIKKELKNWPRYEYEVGFDYDKDGFIEKATIEEIDNSEDKE